MRLRSIGIDTITFVLTSRPDFISDSDTHGQFLSHLQASNLHYRVTTDEDGVQMRPAYGETAIRTEYKGLNLISKPQMTSVNCPVASMMNGNNIDGFPIDHMNEFVAEVSDRLDIDASIGRISRMDLCVNVDSPTMLTDSTDHYYSVDRRYKELLIERTTKYFGCKSKENAIYSQAQRYPEGSEARDLVRAHLRQESEICDMIRWELRLFNGALNRNRITLSELIQGTQHNWLRTQYTRLLGIVGIDLPENPVAANEVRVDMFDGVREFKQWCIVQAVNAVGKEDLMNALLANKRSMDPRLFRALVELVVHTPVANDYVPVVPPAVQLKEVVVNAVNDVFRRPAQE